MNIEKITKQNINRMQNIYNDFTKIAVNDFLFETPPLNFADFYANFNEGFIKAYLYNNDEPQGFLLYSDNLTESIEITLIYTKNNNPEITTSILQNFLEDAKQLYKNKTISYPMLGIQNSFSENIKKLGFSTIGQIVMETSSNTTTIKKIDNPYTITPWTNSYFDNAVKIVHKEFSEQNDAKFDVRFKTLNGCKNIVECITKEIYGKFLPSETTILLYNNEPVGFCFLNMLNNTTANIPLLVVDKSHQGKNLGNLLVKASVGKIQKKNIKLISTTTDAENTSAIKSYTKAGFYKKYSYNHAYLQI